MKLVVGGAYQGKKEAACSLFACRMEEILDGASCDLSEIEACTAISNFHFYVRRWSAQRGGTAQELADGLINKNPGLIVICNEIGCGVVPLDPGERAWREMTGRVCCLLAGYADTVVRVAAGIPVFIKSPGRSAGGQA